MYKFLPFIALLAASVQGDHAPAPPAPIPAYKPAPKYEEAPQPYAFQYGVADDYSGAKFSAEENADGKITSGSYQVALPDGRIQTVTYTVDAYNGFVADVAYEGTPVYPKYEPKPAPAYKPAPYHAPAPATSPPLLTSPLLPTSPPATPAPSYEA
ncbi:Putative LOC100870303 [Caligus rogercresseyi]|uniref:LOC100870303 n=1 Tax=Caligus rogercresseyi TaxID=217165 RepID=A0A7T8GNR5_CALRO|nr:Putative LOC100870303 [Caligus rogercresseyi]